MHCGRDMTGHARAWGKLILLFSIYYPSIQGGRFACSSKYVEADESSSIQGNAPLHFVRSWAVRGDANSCATNSCAAARISTGSRYTESNGTLQDKHVDVIEMPVGGHIFPQSRVIQLINACAPSKIERSFHLISKALYMYRSGLSKEGGQSIQIGITGSLYGRYRRQVLSAASLTHQTMKDQIIVVELSS